MDELKSLVASTLEKKGVMNKIRARLRAEVFKAIEEQESSSGKPQPETQATKRLQEMTATPQAALVLDLIKEWLEFYELDFTHSTLVAEAKLPNITGIKDRQLLLNTLHLTNASPDRPVLMELLAQAQIIHPSTGLSSASSANTSPSHPTPNITSSSSSFAQSKFSAPSISIELKDAQSRSPELSPTSTHDSPSSSSASISSTGGGLRATKSDDAVVVSGLRLDARPSGIPTLPRGSPVSVNKLDSDELEVSPSGSRSHVSRRSQDNVDVPLSPGLAPSSYAHAINTSADSQSISFDQSPSPRDHPSSASGRSDSPSLGGGSESHGPGNASRRRKDRNLDMAHVHTLVQTPAAATTTILSPSSAATTPSSSNHFSSSSSALPTSLATNRSALHPAPDVPVIELAESSDLEASTTSISNEHNSSMDMDKARLAEVNRMIKSYESQIPKIGGGANPPISAAAASSSVDDEDEYGDEQFAASDAGELDGSHTQGGGAIEESLEVEEQLVDGSKVDDSFDGEYFHSSSSLGGGADQRKSQPSSFGSGGQRKTSLPLSVTAEQSVDGMSYESSIGAAGADERDPADVYSEDQSVNEPLENQYDYTEEVEQI